MWPAKISNDPEALNALNTLLGGNDDTSPVRDPIQWTAPAPNDVSWETIALYLIIFSAATTFGLGRVFRHLIDNEVLSLRWELYYRLAMVAVCVLVCGVIGSRVWDWQLGACMGFFGSALAPTVMFYVTKLLSVFIPMLRNGEPPKNGKGKK